MKTKKVCGGNMAKISGYCLGIALLCFAILNSYLTVSMTASPAGPSLEQIVFICILIAAGMICMSLAFKDK